jgi:hypothetical protein
MRRTQQDGRSSVDVNLGLLRTVATRIGTLRERVMFLGGTILPLLVHGEVATDIRVAKDVDIMVHADSKADLWAFEDALWEAGLKRRTAGSTCHWRADDIHVDVLTTEPEAIDFVNRWGMEAMQQKQRCDLGGGLVINVARSTHYMATKIDAFERRGYGRYHSSNDVYDMLLILRGCPDLESDFRQHTSPALQSHLSTELSALATAGMRWQREGTAPRTAARPVIMPSGAVLPAFDAFERQWKPEAVERIRRLVGANGHARSAATA